MTLRLSVDSAKWNRQIETFCSNYGDFVPVVKGNGYGFGRKQLLLRAADFSQVIAVGTVFEAKDVPENRIAMVLTPAGRFLPKTVPSNSVLTVGSIQHLENLISNSWKGQVVVKLQSSMRRYGVDSNGLQQLLDAIKNSEITQVGWSIHPPIEGTPTDLRQQIEQWMTLIDSRLPWYVSHIDSNEVRALAQKFVNNRVLLRAGTQLWLGDKSAFKLTAEVLDTKQVTAGQVAGYRNITITKPGTIVMIGAGTSHGINMVGQELSPFHFNQSRLNLVEPCHMHSSMVFVPTDGHCPKIGDQVDVQQPMTRVYPDLIDWR